MATFDGKTVIGNPTPTKLLDFFAFEPSFNGGDRVAVPHVNNDGTVAPGFSGGVFVGGF